MAENKFMNLLSDIDEKYIKDMTEEKESGKEKEEQYQSAKIVSVRKKKGTALFTKIFSYTAAAAVLAAAVGLGAGIIKENLLADPALSGTAASDVSIAPNQTDNAELPVATNAVTVPIEDIPTAAVKDLPYYVDFNALLKKNDLSGCPAVDISQIPNIDDAYEKIFYNYGSEENMVITEAILDTKACGDFNLSLIGYGLFTDEKAYPDTLISFYGFRIALVKNNFVISSVIMSPDLFVWEESSANGLPWFALPKSGISEVTAVEDFGDNQVVMARVWGDIFAHTHFYGVVNNELYLCQRLDLESAAECVECTSGICGKGSAKENFTVVDELFKKEFHFDFFGDSVGYTVTASDFDTSISSYPLLTETNIPVINEKELEGSFEEKSMQLIEYSLPRAVIDGLQEDNIILYLVGEYIRTDSSNTDIITCSGLKILVYEDGYYIGSIPVEQEAFSSMRLEEEEYKKRMPRLFIMDDAALIVKDLSGSYYGTGCFYAVQNGNLYGSLDGSWSNALGEPPEWTKDKTESTNIYPNYSTNSIVCGFKQYFFDFENLESEGIAYWVYWIDEIDENM